MSREYEMIPQLDHYACMVDILGIAGRVLEAQKLINQMPMEPDSVVWSAFLGACRKHGEAQLAAAQAAARLMELDPASPERGEYGKLQRFIEQLKELGYVSETSLAHKEEQLHYHSEKLALAFAVMVRKERSPKAINIIKNIRICVDCHNFMKQASGSLCQEIVVRDANRFTPFQGSALLMQ
ncbi:hypothetical protein SAY86_012208 [Trapa natans]|uniref:DYW domain-containing protein n=1 Tax=Trapa natans TaxID=22666 RepID=A0AAN7LXL9_TRANT|nr:hypothetical protein SAY86_012208 [Trapa natans]